MASAKGIIKRATRIQKKTGMSSHDSFGLAVKRATAYQQGFGLPNQPGQGSDARLLSRGVASGEITTGQRRKTLNTLKRLGSAPRKSGFADKSAAEVVGFARERRAVSKARAVQSKAARKANTSSTPVSGTTRKPTTAMSQDTINAMRGRGTGRNRGAVMNRDQSVTSIMGRLRG